MNAFHLKHSIMCAALVLTCSWLMGCTIIRSDTWPVSEKKIILSFDDGPNKEISSTLLDVLARHEVNATFCYVGRNVAKYPDLVKRAVEEGHEIAIHSYSRRFATFFEYAPLVKDMEDTRAAIRRAVNNPSLEINLYRPPSGVITLTTRRLIKEKNLDLAYISFYVHDAPVSANKADRVLEKMKKTISKHRGGSIVFHESRFKKSYSTDNNVDKSWLPGAIDELIIWAKKNGYEFVSFLDRPAPI